MDGVGDVVGDAGDGVGDLVRCLVARIAEESGGLAAVVVGRSEGGGAGEGEGVVVEEGEVDMGVVRDPGETLLDAGDFEADEAVENFFDGVVEDGAAEGDVERFGHLVGEHVESGVEGSGGGVDPAEDVVVDVLVRGQDHLVRARRPGFGGVIELLHDLSGKVPDLMSKSRDFFLDDA